MESKPLVPKLRFPEFRNAPGWEEKELKRICEINPASADLPSSFIYIDLESVEAGQLRAKNRVERGNAPSRAQRLLRSGDTVFQIVRPYQRNNLFFDFEDGDSYVASTGYAQLRAHDDAAFLYQAVHTEPFVNRVIAKCTGSSYPAINSSDLANVKLLVPTTPTEQTKIAGSLTLLDKLIAAEGKKLEALRAHKKGLMQSLFPREGETTPRLRFPEFVSAWEARRFGELLKESERPVDMDAETEYALVTVKRRYGGVVAREVLKGRAIKVKSQFIVEANDFLISKRQIVHNACGLVPEMLGGSIVSNEYSVLTPKDGCDIKFFNYFAQQPCVSESFLQSSVGIVIEKMLFKLERWLRFAFPFPSPPEQQRIAECLASLDALIIGQSEKITALRQHKQGLMQQLFPVGETE